MLSTEVSLLVAFVAGIAYFFSPCVWPLYPAYITYLAGSSIEIRDDLASAERQRMIVNAVGFVLGFSAIFIALGATASFLGELLLFYQTTLRIASGLLIVAFGFFMVGWLRLDFLQQEFKISVEQPSAQFFGAIGLGAAFGFGWTPCVGPILAAIFLLAGTSASVGEGTLLLAVYSAGLAIPFLILAVFFERLSPHMDKIGRYLPAVAKASGILLILIGLLIITNYFSLIAAELFYMFQ